MSLLDNIDKRFNALHDDVKLWMHRVTDYQLQVECARIMMEIMRVRRDIAQAQLDEARRTPAPDHDGIRYGDFAYALKQLKAGRKVARRRWQGYLYMDSVEAILHNTSYNLTASDYEANDWCVVGGTR